MLKEGTEAAEKQHAIFAPAVSMAKPESGLTPSSHLCRKQNRETISELSAKGILGQFKKIIDRSLSVLIAFAQCVLDNSDLKQSCSQLQCVACHLNWPQCKRKGRQNDIMLVFNQDFWEI